MMLSTYDPRCQAVCPKCNKLVVAEIQRGNLVFNQYVIIEHKECGTVWRLDLQLS